MLWITVVLWQLADIAAARQGVDRYLECPLWHRTPPQERNSPFWVAVPCDVSPESVYAGRDDQRFPCEPPSGGKPACGH